MFCLLGQTQHLAGLLADLEQLEKKQDLHNNAVERLYKVEQKVAVHEEKFSVANHRIDDLEHNESA